ncbi:hypothetical protein TNCV_3385191 [Trichonephila clavipes]|uniref:Uncharacterized protein n=1 Tax=Trichonephila clavipes TaxID=2585209 RepID=A0A8X6SYX7_TRICX|nr:hypothetical protein TNCV_3385191 [Trichonephila clavipes]
MEFEQERINGLREGGFSYHAIRARAQRNGSTLMRVWKQWTDEHRTNGKSGSGRPEGDISTRRSTLAPHGGE